MAMKKVAVVRVEMVNGNNSQVMVNTVTGKPVYYKNTISETFWDDIAKSIEDNKRT